MNISPRLTVSWWFCAAALLPATGAHAAPEYVSIAGAELRSVLPPDGRGALASIKPFRMRTLPVTNGEFLAFVVAQPRWQRDAAPTILADASYLSRWSAPLQFGTKFLPQQPVTQVSWFAADEYCRSEHARLPRWYEWELVAAADQTRRDARADPRWREAILRWYSRPASTSLPLVGQTPSNIYGVRDLHGLVWEWVDDFNSIMISGDNREQGDPDLLKFCGAGAITMKDRENYAVLMRLALLSSLQARNSTSTLGFRCVKDGH